MHEKWKHMKTKGNSLFFIKLSLFYLKSSEVLSSNFKINVARKCVAHSSHLINADLTC